MTKLLCWLFIKSITPEIKIVFSNNGSSFEYATNTVYLDFNDDCTGFMRHLKFEHGMRGADNFNIIMWQMLHEVGHFYTLDYCEDDESLERTICALIDEDEAKNSEKIQNIYFNLEKLQTVCEALIDKGFEIGVITWLAKNGSKRFNRNTAETKKLWVKNNMPYVTRFTAQEYGTPKQKALDKSIKFAVLVDDNKEVREMWNTPKQRKSIDANLDIITKLWELV